MNRLSRKGCLASAALLAALLPCPVRAQEQAAAAAAKAAASQSHAEEYEAFRRNSYDQSYKLRYATNIPDQNEILTAIRNMADPATKIFLVPSVGTIVVRAPKEAQDQVAKLLETLDQPHPHYRLTYTVSEFDGAKKIGLQHFSMVLAPGQHSVMKQGSRIPIQAGYSTDTKNSQIVYVDVGMNFDATLSPLPDGALLKTKVEQSSIAPDTPTSRPTYISAANADPIIRQTTFEGAVALVTNKALLIGSLDVPSSTHRFEVETLLELVK